MCTSCKRVQLLEDYLKCFIVGADNVDSKKIYQIHKSLRGSAVVLVGKNTLMRKVIKGHLERNGALEKLRGNVRFVFTRGDLVEVHAPARPGAIDSLSVIIPAQNTDLGPEKTSSFQALSIPTKISNDVHILWLGDKVGASVATVANLTLVCLRIGYPTTASAPF